MLDEGNLEDKGVCMGNEGNKRNRVNYDIIRLNAHWSLWLFLNKEKYCCGKLRFTRCFFKSIQGESKKTDTFVIHLNIKCISFF
jgi:hypothetical protein